MSILTTHRRSRMKISGFNEKEQKLFNKLKNGEEFTIRELKVVFVKDAEAHCREIYSNWDESAVNIHAQSYVRNAMRRLVRDGWVDGPHTKDSLGRGTYRLSTVGRHRVEKDVTETPSAGRKKREPKEAKIKKEKVVKAREKQPVETAPKRKPGRPRKVVAEVETAPKRKPGRPRKVVETAVVEAAPKRKPGRPRKVVAEVVAASKGKKESAIQVEVVAKAKAASKRAEKEAAREKAALAARRVAEEISRDEATTA
jgi:hypothetical protein